MRRTVLLVVQLLVLGLLLGGSLAAQGVPDLLVTPDKVNMVVGDSHMFRAVNSQGRMEHGVQWSVLPYGAAEVRQGDELEIQANVTGKITVIATANGHEAKAEVSVIEGTRLPVGSSKWTLTELPGKKTTKITPAVPSAGGEADIFVEERGEGGRVIRAVASDGRELWRTYSEKPLTQSEIANLAPPTSQLDARRATLCDSVAVGMTRTQVRDLAAGSGITLSPAEMERPHWSLEQAGSGCTVDFDAQGTVSRKRKVLTN